VPDDLDQVSSLIVPGGESTTMSLLLGTSGLFEPLRQRLADGMPALGTCAGMIMLAAEIVDGRADQRCFGAIDISVRRNAFGRQRESFEADLDVAGLDGPGLDGPGLDGPGLDGPGLDGPGLDGPGLDGPGLDRSGLDRSGLDRSGLARPLHAVFIRAPVVERVGVDVEVLATVRMGDGQEKAVVCRQGSVLVSSFHPELVGEPRLHELFLQTQPRTRKDHVRAL
jgi:5'-phosphate synthase pdxT subunit